MQAVLDIDDAPVIFISGYGREDLIVRAFDREAVDDVVKPFSPTELTARIRAALYWVRIAGRPVRITACMC